MKILKKNQIIIYVIVLMLMTASYLNYAKSNNKESLETSVKMNSKDDTMIADIGDATLVNSNDITKEEPKEEIKQEQPLEENIQTNAQVTDEYFIKSKIERETMYSQMLEIHEKILNNTNSSEAQKQAATQEIGKINETKNKTMICENLIQIKGFNSNIIFVNGDSINVVVKAQEIKTEEIAQIQNIISREMNAKIENIHITSRK